MRSDLERVPWWEAEPAALARETRAMKSFAPELSWVDDDPSGAWLGPVPIWPFGRPQPEHLDSFLDGARMTVSVEYTQAFPIASPRIYPVDPDLDPNIWTLHKWHVNGDGSLCLMQNAVDWTPNSTAADLVIKSSAWFLEYLLLVRNQREEMSECGIVNDDSLDGLFVERVT